MKPFIEVFEGVGKIKKLRRSIDPAIFARMLIIILVILGFFLLYSVVSQASYGPGYAAEGLLITVVLYTSISLWVILMDKKAKRWEKTLLIVGMIVASFVFFLSTLVGLTMPGWAEANPTAAQHLSATAEYLFITAVILACAVILVFLVQYIDEVVLQRRGPFPVNKIEQRKPMSFKLTVSFDSNIKKPLRQKN